MSATWSITESYLRRKSWEIENVGDEEALIKLIEAEALERGYAPLEIEGYGDETHFFFRDKRGKRRCYLRAQYEG